MANLVNNQIFKTIFVDISSYVGGFTEYWRQVTNYILTKSICVMMGLKKVTK